MFSPTIDIPHNHFAQNLGVDIEVMDNIFSAGNNELISNDGGLNPILHLLKKKTKEFEYLFFLDG